MVLIVESGVEVVVGSMVRESCRGCEHWISSFFFLNVSNVP